MHAPSPKLRKVLLSSALMVAVLTIPSGGTQSKDLNEVEDETSAGKLSEATAESVSVAGIVIEAEFGQWQSQLAGSQALGSNEMEATGLATMTATPTVSSYEDLQRHMLGDTFTPDMHRDKILSFLYQTFQQIPGVPLDPRYQDDRFDIVRQGFSQQCKDASDGYQQLLAITFVSPNGNVLDVLKRGQVSRIATSYELACLTALHDVPLNVRQVLGVLVIGTSPFCSATIIGDKRVLTSRHCFVDPSTGNGLTYLNHWKDGNVSFVPAVPQNSRQSFKLEEPSADVLATIIGTFAPRLDYWVVHTTRKMEFAAIYEEASSDVNQYPITAWLVGNNINLDDIGQARMPLEFVRGAAPTACSVLERTAVGCLYHTCQSSPSTSGAGILVPNAEGAVKLVGVHKGTIAEAAGCEATPPTSLRLNFAITDLSL